MTLPHEQYESVEYFRKNPLWDAQDSPWKAQQALRVIRSHDIKAKSVVEVGCGAEGVLRELRQSMLGIKLSGFDIAPDAARFWTNQEAQGISFELGDFLISNTAHFDLLLLLDVIEHVPDPFDFLVKPRQRADNFIFHIPLDLSALSVLREKPLLNQRRNVGHIHYFTKGLAPSILQECGYQVVDWFYTGAFDTLPAHNWKTALARLPRKLTGLVNKDLAVRLLGGETLMVLARPAAGT